MPKPRKVAKMESALVSKGFIRENTHHRKFWLHVDGKKTKISTKFSHGLKEYERNLLKKVKRQLHLDEWIDFNNLFDCPMTHAQYVAVLVAKGLVKLG